jgi:hypothetical protein
MKRVMVALVLAAGCSSTAPDADVARITLVDLHPDRPADVRVMERVKQSELDSQAENGIGVAQSAITVDNPCGYYGYGTPYLAMYVDHNYSATDGIICFRGQGVAYLRDYCWSGYPGGCYLTWEQVAKFSWFNYANGGTAYHGYFYDGTNSQTFTGNTGQPTSSYTPEYAVSVVIQP